MLNAGFYAAERKMFMENGIVYFDPRKGPFAIYGLCTSGPDGSFRRIPDEVAVNVSQSVRWLAMNTAGGRIRFRTDSDILAVKVKTGHTSQMYHATPALETGFDVYTDTEHGSVFVGLFKPDFMSRAEYECELRLPEGDKEITVNMPLYGNVESLMLGLRKGASVSAHSSYGINIPVVYYGSSITQGGCASRPGKSYQAIISRRLDCDYINLGFSGSAKGEPAIVEYISGLKMSAFVCDYDHNAPNHEHLRNTHYLMYEKIREKHPDIPYLMVSKPDFKFNSDDTERRCIIMESYVKAYRGGDKNVYFVDGSAFFNGEELADCTVDACHPTDDGFRRMADYIGSVLLNAMRRSKIIS